MAAADGKVTPAGVRHLVEKRSDIHYPKPRVVSLTQATEQGTRLHARRGARRRRHRPRARAARSTWTAPASPTPWPRSAAARPTSPGSAGVDVLCFGGTKNGMAVGEAVVFFDRALSAEFDYRCKQAGQLASKMRFLAAPWVGMLRDGAWLRHAARANQQAGALHQLLSGIPGATPLRPPQANSVFVNLPPGVADAVRARGWRFYDFIAGAGSRLMTAWDTSDADLAAFAADLREVLGAPVR